MSKNPDVQKIVDGIDEVMGRPHDKSGYQGHCPLCGKQLFVSKFKTVDCPEGHYAASIPVFEAIWNTCSKLPVTEQDNDENLAKLIRDLKAINIIELDDDGNVKG